MTDDEEEKEEETCDKCGLSGCRSRTAATSSRKDFPGFAKLEVFEGSLQKDELGNHEPIFEWTMSLKDIYDLFASLLDSATKHMSEEEKRQWLQ